MSPFEVCILGTSSAVPAHGRHLSAQVVNHNNRLYLIDCGEGTQFQLQRYRQRLRRLDAIFISHLHGDHLLGLPGLLNSLSLNGRRDALTLTGPSGLKRYLRLQFEVLGVRLSYALDIREIHPPVPAEPVFATAALEVTALPLQHRVPTYGYRFRETPHRPAFLAEQARELGVPPPYFRLLKQGNAVRLPDGRDILPEAVLGERPPQRCYAYCSDTAYAEALVPYLRGCDLLYHEATFLQDLAERAAETGHSTAGQAAEIARQAEAGGLLLGHFSARYPEPTPLEEEAQAQFAKAWAAREGWIYDIASGGQQARQARDRPDRASSFLAS